MLHLLVSTSAAPARKLDAAWPPVLEPPCGFLFFPCPPAEAVQAPPSSPSNPSPQGKIQTIVAFPGTLQAVPYDFVAPYNEVAPPITDNKEITNYTLPPQAHEIAYNNVTHRVFFSNVPYGLMGEISLSQQKEKALNGSGITFYQRWGSPVEGVVPGVDLVDLSDDDDPNGWQHVGHFDRYTDHNLGNWLTDDRKINGLHNVGPSNHECVRPDNRQHPGALWLSEQYGDRVLLVDPSNMSAPPIYELRVPFDVHGPQVLGPELGGEIFRSRLYNTPRFITMGPHAVHETPDCRIAVALKGPYDDGTVKVESECRDPKHVEMREGKAAYAWHRNLLADRHAPDHVNLAIVGHFSNSVLDAYRGMSLSQTSNQARNHRAVRMDLVKSVLKAYQCARFLINCELDNDVESANIGAKVLALIRAAFGSRNLTTPLRSFDANPTDAVETPPLLLRVLDATAAGLSLDRAADGGEQEQDDVLKFFFSFFPPTTFPEAMSSYKPDNAEQVQQAIYGEHEHQYLKCTYESFQKAPFWLRRQICNKLALSNDIVFDYVCNPGCPRADDSGRGAVDDSYYSAQGSYDSYYSADTFQYATWVVDPNHYNHSAPVVMDGWPTVKQPSGYKAKGGLLYDTGAQPVQITTDREGNIYVAQDSTPSVLRIEKMDKFGRNMSEQINVGFGNKFGLNRQRLRPARAFFFSCCASAEPIGRVY